MKILVVDDEELIRNVIKEYLINDSYEVDEADNGLEAIEMAKNNNYDLIVMDIMMPKMDGYQACKEIKKIKQNVISYNKKDDSGNGSDHSVYDRSYLA